MIKGLGVDLIEIDRVERFVQKGERYARRVFTSAELELAASSGQMQQFLAGRFAAKEAVAKALGPPFTWHEVEVLQSDQGAPIINLNGRALEASAGARVMVSISHSRGFAVAMAVVEDGG